MKEGVCSDFNDNNSNANKLKREDNGDKSRGKGKCEGQEQEILGRKEKIRVNMINIGSSTGW